MNAIVLPERSEPYLGARQQFLREISKHNIVRTDDLYCQALASGPNERPPFGRHQWASDVIHDVSCHSPNKDTLSAILLWLWTKSRRKKNGRRSEPLCVSRHDEVLSQRRVRRQASIKAAIRSGADLLLGSHYAKHSAASTGRYLTPTASIF
jgi:hypothetical protein